MKHITPQAQNHIFKERRCKKPMPFHEGDHGAASFITLDELKILEKKRKNTMDSDDSDSDAHTSRSCIYTDTNDKNTETNDETMTTDGKETYNGEEDAEDDDVNQSEMAANDGNDDGNDYGNDYANDEGNDEGNDYANDEGNDYANDEGKKEKEELELNPEKFTVKNSLKKKRKKICFTMNYEAVDDEW